MRTTSGKYAQNIQVKQSAKKNNIIILKTRKSASDFRETKHSR